MKSVKRKLSIGQGKMYALKDKQGNIISNFDDIVKAAEEFYTDLYSSQSSQATFIRNSDEPDTEAPSITSAEVRRALKDMTRGKAAGEDGITVDLIKDGGDIMLEKLAALYTQCLTTSSVPESWKNANIILIHKKGDVKELKNYRPISLLSVLYKIFTKIISNRIRATLDFSQPREQAGFRKGYSTMDHIHVINQVIEKSAEYNQPLYMAFIDYEKAFDSVEIPAVIEALRNQGVQEAYVNILANIYKDSTATLVLHKKSRKLPIKKGVRQGDTISPMLFTACLEEVFKLLDWEGLGVRINGEYLSNLRFADDIVLFSNNGDELQQMIEDLNRESVRIGLKMNMQKTKIMFNSLAREQEFRTASQPL